MVYLLRNKPAVWEGKGADTDEQLYFHNIGSPSQATIYHMRTET
jgi:hypothetical protein